MKPVYVKRHSRHYRGAEPKITIHREPADRKRYLRRNEVTPRSRSYVEAASMAGGKNRNLWIKQEDDENSGRVLLVQFSSKLLSSAAFESPEAKRYYDSVYENVPGYERAEDFWEVPTWMAHMAGAFRNSDVYVVRDVDEASRFLNEAGYGGVFFSALDANKDLIKGLAQNYGGRVFVGGYVRRQEFDDQPNVTWFDTIAEATEAFGVEPSGEPDYRHFEGTAVIPRLCMSTGCAYDCAFCSIEKQVKTTPKEEIDRNVKAILALDGDLIYMNDKTFGQASNYTYLRELNQRIKAARPSFKGFIVQTTATQFLKIPDDFLRDSGIQIVEIGVESYNDDILKSVRKPHRVAHIDQAVAKLRAHKIKFVPNVIVGLPGESEESYARTMQFLKTNEDVISHINVYNLALYESARLKDEMGLLNLSAGDVNENTVEKSFYKNPELHKRFALDVYKLGEELARRQA